MGKAVKKEKEKVHKKKEKPKKAKPPEKIDEDMKGIVRIAGKDVRGHIPLNRGLLRVKGIGHTLRKVFAEIISQEMGISPTEKVGKLSDAQLETLENILFKIHEREIPSYLLNRRKDSDTGENIHVIMNDLVFAQRQDIEREKKLYTWKGYRHAYGQRVRGQKTRNTGRGGAALGVIAKAQKHLKGDSKGSKGKSRK
ncbi:30S ribosomal protein S13 [Candidatus Micrarchaeota archaeon]|nr:30S ribosomal protein S13 [Candidatus Micrarchaeota archaeon]